MPRKALQLLTISGSSSVVQLRSNVISPFSSISVLAGKRCSAAITWQRWHSFAMPSFISETGAMFDDSSRYGSTEFVVRTFCIAE